MAINFEDIKKLKTMTGVGMNDAKAALQETDGDFDKALEAMRVKGIAKAGKKADRATEQGMIHSYVHSGRIGVLVEVNCETDFVARTDEFKAFVNDIALHVAASAPQFLDGDEVSQDAKDKELDLVMKELENEGKPKEMVEKIAQGKMAKWESTVTLMGQPYVKDPSKSVEEFTKEIIAQLGENITIRRFVRIEMGEDF